MWLKRKVMTLNKRITRKMRWNQRISKEGKRWTLMASRRRRIRIPKRAEN